MACTKIFVAFVLVTLFTDAFSATVYQKQRSVPESLRRVRDVNAHICQNQTPCGWAVYKPFTRQVEYFLKNRCECASDKKCVRSYDDLSVSAYVYRCKHKTESS